MTKNVIRECKICKKVVTIDSDANNPMKKYICTSCKIDELHLLVKKSVKKINELAENNNNHILGYVTITKPTWNKIINEWNIQLEEIKQKMIEIREN
jgi:uncharacterized protein YlaI